jgi:hypothetical protein
MNWFRTKPAKTATGSKEQPKMLNLVNSMSTTQNTSNITSRNLDEFTDMQQPDVDQSESDLSKQEKIDTQEYFKLNSQIIAIEAENKKYKNVLRVGENLFVNGKKYRAGVTVKGRIKHENGLLTIVHDDDKHDFNYDIKIYEENDNGKFVDKGSIMNYVNTNKVYDEFEKAESKNDTNYVTNETDEKKENKGGMEGGKGHHFRKTKKPKYTRKRKAPKKK